MYLSLFAFCLAYAAAFSALAILQSSALMVPHADTGMYEEHLWNLLHGKGFRSQIDSGRLFLGEHLQVIHLLLIPIYLIYPHLATLSVCESLALALGAIAVARMVFRGTGSALAANLLALAYLFYYPLHFLNLEASLKTFRPDTFAVPLFLFAFDAADGAKYRRMIVLLVLAALAGEPFVPLISMLGLYLFARSLRKPAATGLQPSTFNLQPSTRVVGLAIFLTSVAYLLFVLQIFIPHFRGGAAPHYTQYFALGSTPGEVVRNVIRDPLWAAGRVLTPDKLMLPVAILLPVAFLPLASPLRLAVLVPNLAFMWLSQRQGVDTPLFHWHAPLVPVIWWATAAALSNLARRFTRPQPLQPAVSSRPPITTPRPPAASSDSPSPPADALLATHHSRLTLAASRLAAFIVGLAVSTSFWLGKSPLALEFWDPGRQGAYWRNLYVPSPRVESFWRLYPLVPTSARVAATDFVRNPFTHHRRVHVLEYDKVRHAYVLLPHVQADEVDFLVIDRRGPYNEDPRTGILVDRPDQYEEVFVDPYFFAARRKSFSSTAP